MLDKEKFELIAGGHTAFQLFWAGIRMGLFNLLSNKPGLKEEEIQQELKLEKKPMRILLAGLLTLGLIERKDSTLYNCQLVEDHLVDGKPLSMTPIFDWQAQIVYPALVDFVPSLQENRNVGLRHFPGTGNTLYERLVSNPDLEKVFQKAMSSLSLKTNEALLRVYDFKRFKHILDIGGGDGTNVISLVQNYPSLHATVFDMPSVSDLAKSNVHKRGLDERVKVQSGDFLKDPFPEGPDGIMFNHIFPIWSEERNLELLRKSYKLLPKGGSVFIFNMMSSDDDIGPLTPAFGSLYFLAIATGEGMLYRWKDYVSWLKQAGFVRIERIENLPLHHGLLVGSKE